QRGRASPTRPGLRAGAGHGRDRRDRDGALHRAAAADRPVAAMTRSRRLRLQAFRVVVFIVFGAFFLVPIGAMFEFSTRGNGLNAPRTLSAWLTITQYPDLVAAILAAIDIKTLSEAARSLGAGWPTVMGRIIVPNMWTALLNAALLSVAVVLGEFTIANLLNYVNLQVSIALLGRANAGVSIAVAVASLMFAFVLLVILSFFGRPRARVARLEEAPVSGYGRQLGGGMR